MNNGTVCYQDVKKFFRGNGMFVGKYLHTIYPKLSQLEEAVFLKELSLILNEDYLCFLREHNGLNLFSDSLVFYGFGRIIKNGVPLSSRDPNNPLPFHLFDENGRRINASKIKIGSVCETGLFMNNSTGVITRISKEGNAIDEWKSIDDCLSELYSKLIKHYDDKGICQNPIIINNLTFNKVQKI